MSPLSDPTQVLNAATAGKQHRFQELLSWLNQSSDNSLAGAPDLALQIISWGHAYNLLFTILFGALIIVCVILFALGVKLVFVGEKRDRNGHRDGGNYGLPGLFLSIVSFCVAIVFLVLALSYVSELVQVNVAPKVFLMEKLDLM